MNAIPFWLAIFSIPTYLTVAYFGLAVSRMGVYRAQRCLEKLNNLFFYRRIHFALFQRDKPSLFFAIVIAAETLRFLGFAAVFFTVLNSDLSFEFRVPLLVFSLFIFSAVGDFLPRLWTWKYPQSAIKPAALLTSIALSALLPLQWLLIKAFHLLGNRVSNSPDRGALLMKERMMDILHEGEEGSEIDLPDKEILRGVLNYQERIVKEVMVPRVQVFCLPADMTIKEAAEKILIEGFTRTPIYRDQIDQVLGILMTKDLFQVLANVLFCEKNHHILERPVETLVKPVLFAPENKPVSQLMNEFRKKKVHLAIVVDEYGGTEGIVTIEDILEEIVGDIQDEYDEANPHVSAQPDGTFIVDGRMSIFDVQEHTAIEIPQSKDYDSLSGYVFHRAGKIPEKGFSIHHDDFDLEIITSSERRVEKVRIRPLSQNRPTQTN